MNSSHMTTGWREMEIAKRGDSSWTLLDRAERERTTIAVLSCLGTAEDAETNLSGKPQARENFK
jgi:hypothetical protein